MAKLSTFGIRELIHILSYSTRQEFIQLTRTFLFILPSNVLNASEMKTNWTYKHWMKEWIEDIIFDTDRDDIMLQKLRRGNTSCLFSPLIRLA